LCEVAEKKGVAGNIGFAAPQGCNPKARQFLNGGLCDIAIFASQNYFRLPAFFFLLLIY
jgi:hypothetical protein